MNNHLRFFAAVLCLAGAALSASARCAVNDSLFLGFANPSKEYAPRVWWHWMHGNVTRDGIRKDLEWMDRAGIGGFHQFNAQLAPTHVIVDKRIELFSPEWDDMFSYALDVADSLGLEVSIASSPGWSATGGPWVKEEDAQKKLTWRSLDVKGGRRLDISLPEPYEFSGPFQDKPLYPDDIYRFRFYRDIAVLAVRMDGMEPEDTVAAWINKAGFIPDWRVGSHFPATTAAHAAREVLDISGKVRNGVLHWKAPRGEWKIMRFGYNLLGKQNGPVEKAGKGLEADKLSREAMTRYYDDYLSIMDKAGGHRLGSVIKYVMIDSYEAGKGSWTPLMPEEFKARRGYDLIPWLPVLAGIPIGSASQSDDFLFDWKLTLGEMITEYHYDLADSILARYGMRTHVESHEQATAFMGDGMMPKRRAAVPMGAIWVNFNNGWYASNPTADADIHESASVAHIYGGNVCAAESFSVNSRPTVAGHFPAYQCHPANLKRLADAAMSEGLNRFILHCSPHQPCDSLFPGLGLGSFGNWFNRHETWAEEASPWHDYLRRSCYMLQQGRYVADIAYLYGEDTNITARFREARPDIPFGYSYDFVNSDILQNVLEVKDGHLVSPGGMEYSILLIDNRIDVMTPALESRIEELRRAGVTVCDARGEDVGKTCLSALRRVGIEPDLIVRDRPGDDGRFRFLHRALPGADIYWIGNISPEGGEFPLSLRTSDGSVSYWDAESGTRTPLGAEFHDGRLECRLHLDQDGAGFVVVDHSGKASAIPGRKVEYGETIIGSPWEVAFKEGLGAPASTRMTSLERLDCNEDEGIRHYSGTAVYSTDFELKSIEGTAVLDLGDVYHMARVYLNGRNLGLSWHSPYVLDTDGALKSGTNHLEIEVTNDWANRLIGDSSKPAGQRITYTPWQFYSPESPLQPSGLQGPVKLIWFESQQ